MADDNLTFKIADWLTLPRQYARLKRSLERLDHELHGGGNYFNGTDKVDAVHVFFMHAHHMKDYLSVHMAAVGRADARAVVEGFINETAELRLAADVANGNKHSELTSTRTGDKSTAVVGGGGSGNPVDGFLLHMEIESNGVQYDVWTTAKQCVAAWETFAAREGISLEVPSG